MNGVDFLNIQNIFYRIYQLITNFSIPNLLEFIAVYWPLVSIISLFISILLIVGIIRYYLKLIEVKEKDKEIYGTIKTNIEDIEEEIKNERWLKVLDHLDTESQSEWRTAIIESDIILDEMMIKMGYHGDNLGERMKAVEKSDFTTIDFAWEAHKTRNIIAHEGSNFMLSKREAKRVVDLYRQVFEEFNFI